MSLQQKLDRIQSSFTRQATPETVQTLEGTIEDLRGSGILDHVVGEGQRAPDFTLKGSRGNDVELSDLLRCGPLVLSFFRGHW